MACRCFELFWCATCGCKTILWNASCVDGGFWGLWAVMTFWQMWLSLVPGSERGGRSRKRLNNHRIGAALQHSRVTEATMPQEAVPAETHVILRCVSLGQVVKLSFSVWLWFHAVPCWKMFRVGQTRGKEWWQRAGGDWSPGGRLSEQKRERHPTLEFCCALQVTEAAKAEAAGCSFPVTYSHFLMEGFQTWPGSALFTVPCEIVWTQLTPADVGDLMPGRSTAHANWGASLGFAFWSHFPQWGVIQR